MQASYLIYFLQPYYKNFNKRMVKAPKLYFYDTGLASFLLGIENSGQLTVHSSKGFLVENWVINKALRANMFYVRDSAGNEIDLVVEEGGRLLPVEIKSAETLNDSFFKNLKYFEKLTGQQGLLIYGGTDTVKYKGHQAVPWSEVSSL
jgi:predicted AAA+ superfamily ATPase